MISINAYIELTLPQIIIRVNNQRFRVVYLLAIVHLRPLWSIGS
jgi:hypothetical protein